MGIMVNKPVPLNKHKSDPPRIFPVITPEGELIGHARIIAENRLHIMLIVLSGVRKVQPAKPLEIVMYWVVSKDGKVIGEAPLINHSYVLVNKNYAFLGDSPVQDYPAGTWDPFNRFLHVRNDHDN